MAAPVKSVTISDGMTFNQSVEQSWQARREQIALTPGTINLNAGTLSPTPLPVLEKMFALRRQMARNPSDFLWRQTPPHITRARGALAKYLNCSPADLLLLPNITFALNIVTTSLRLPAGSEILTTDHEYVAMMNCWLRAAAEQGWTVRVLTLPYKTEDPSELVDLFTREIGSKTRVLYFSHVNCTTGLVMPVQQLAALARQRDLLCVIDGAHAPGMVPVDLTSIGADFYAANCHKWMMAPAGAGFLHVAPHRHAMLRPIITSWGYGYKTDQAEEDSGRGGSHWQWDLEFHGSIDRTAQMVLPETIEFRENVLAGEESIRGRVREVAKYARGVLTAAGFACATPENPSMSGALVAVEFPKCNAV